MREGQGKYNATIQSDDIYSVYIAHIQFTQDNTKNTTQKYNTKKYNYKKYNNKKYNTKTWVFSSFSLSIPSGWCYLLFIGVAYSGVHYVH